MARQTQVTVTLIDDLDGGVAVETVPFAFDGIQMEIDLSKRNKAAMDKAMRPYVDAARRVKVTRGPRRKHAVSAHSSNLAAVREWARGAGLEVAERGRISADVVAAYEAAH